MRVNSGVNFQPYYFNISGKPWQAILSEINDFFGKIFAFSPRFCRQADYLPQYSSNKSLGVHSKMSHNACNVENFMLEV